MRYGDAGSSGHRGKRLRGCALTVVLALAATAEASCDGPPPFLSPAAPITFSVDSSGAVEVDAAQKPFVTHVGTFAVADDVHHIPVPAERTTRTPGQLVTLIIRHEVDGSGEKDDLYQVSAGPDVVVDVDHRVRFGVTDRRVFVDSSGGVVRTIQVDATGRGPGPSVPGGESLPGHTRVGAVTVPGDAANGVQFTAERPGRYQFTYESGSYSTYPINTYPRGRKTWLTTVLLFGAGTRLFDGRRVRREHALASLADTKYWATQDDAEGAAMGQHASLTLRKGDTLTLVAVDRYGHYAANQGAVVVVCEYVDQDAAGS